MTSDSPSSANLLANNNSTLFDGSRDPNDVSTVLPDVQSDNTPSPELVSTSDKVNSVEQLEREVFFDYFVQGMTGALLLSVLAAISGTSFHFGYASGVM